MPNRPPHAAESIVERVTLHIDTRQARPAVVVTNALVPWRPQTAVPPARAPASPASPRSPGATKLARVQLTLRTRPAQPHELAAAPGAPANEATPGAPVDEATASDRTVHVALGDGSRVACSAATLAQHSSVLGMLSRRAVTGEIALLEYPADAVRGVLAWMAAPSGPAKRAAAAQLISPELVVDAARLSHYIDCQPLLRAALVAIGGALDEENAPSCLLLARELGAVELEQRYVGFILEELDSVQQRAEGWAELPLSTRAVLEGLREATQSRHAVRSDEQLVIFATLVTECSKMATSVQSVARWWIGGLPAARPASSTPASGAVVT